MNNKKRTADAPTPLNDSECEFCEAGDIPNGSWHTNMFIDKYGRKVNIFCQKHLSVTIKEKQ